MFGEKERLIKNLNQRFLKERVLQYVKVFQANARGCGLDSSKDRTQ